MLLISAFLNWFRYPDPEVVKLQQQFEVPAQNIETPATLITSTGWEVTSLRYIVYLCAITAIVNFFLLILSRTPGRSLVFSTPVFLLGSVTTLWIVLRALNPPFDDASILNGLFIGLTGAVFVAAGAFLALRDERIPGGFDQAPAPEMLSLPADLPAGVQQPQPGQPAAQSAVQAPIAQPAQQPTQPPSSQPAVADHGESVAPPKHPGA